MAVEHVARLDELVRSRYGLVTTAEAVAILGPSRKQRWVAEGRLLSVQPNVLRMAGAPETWHQSVMAAALSADAIASHRSAAELWGLIPPAGYVDIAVPPPHQPPHPPPHPPPHQARLRPPAVAHRVVDLHPHQVTERQGIPLSDPVRTIIDLGVVLPVWGVRDALRRGLRTRLVPLAEVRVLRDALGRRQPDGTGLVRELLEERLLGCPPEASLLAKRLTDLGDRHGVPPLAVRHEVWHDGRFVARVHAAVPGAGLAIEVDGYEPDTPEAVPDDHTWEQRLVALGWTVLRCPWDDVVGRPERVARCIRGALDRLPAA